MSALFLVFLQVPQEYTRVCIRHGFRIFFIAARFVHQRILKHVVALDFTDENVALLSVFPGILQKGDGNSQDRHGQDDPAKNGKGNPARMLEKEGSGDGSAEQDQESEELEPFEFDCFAKKLFVSLQILQHVVHELVEVHSHLHVFCRGHGEAWIAGFVKKGIAVLRIHVQKLMNQSEMHSVVGYFSR